MCSQFPQCRTRGKLGCYESQKTILEEGYSRSSTRRATRLAGLEEAHRGIMVIQQRTQRILKWFEPKEASCSGGQVEQGEMGWKEWEWTWGQRREESKSKSTEVVWVWVWVWVWSPLLKFVLGVRRTTNGRRAKHELMEHSTITFLLENGARRAFSP